MSTQVATVRVTVDARKYPTRGAGWTAEHYGRGLDGGLRADGATKADAVAALTTIVESALSSAYAPAYLVLHADGTQSVARHWGDGVRLDRIREGKSACSTLGSWGDTAAAAEYAVEHYGPGQVVRL